MRTSKGIPIDEDSRQYVLKLMDQCGITQKGLAENSNVGQPWVSQMLNGRRTMIDGRLLIKLFEGLDVEIRKSEKITQCEKDKILPELQKRYEGLFNRERIIASKRIWTLADSTEYAALIFAELFEEGFTSTQMLEIAERLIVMVPRKNKSTGGEKQ